MGRLSALADRCVPWAACRPLPGATGVSPVLYFFSGGTDSSSIGVPRSLDLANTVGDTYMMVGTTLAKQVGSRPATENGKPMTRENFERVLQAFQRRTPFRRFTVQFVSGQRISVDHPEALVLRSGEAVYISSEGVPTLFDHESVSDVVGETSETSA